jgi:hypothetical protein
LDVWAYFFTLLLVINLGPIYIENEESIICQTTHYF